MSPETHDPELTALASALAALAPAVDRLNRDQILFRAGQAAGPRRGWLWSGATAALALLAAGLGLVALRTPAPQRIEHVVILRTEPPAPAATAAAEPQPAPGDEMPLASEDVASRPAPWSCFQLEQLALRWGVEALPESSPAASPEPARGPDRPFGVRSMRDLLETQTP